MIEDPLTEKILRAAFAVSNELGVGFLESVYENALTLAVTEVGLRVQRQYPLEVTFRGNVVGVFFADLVIDSAVIVELKATRDIAPEHEAQLLNYLKGTGMRVGLLLNFGHSKLQYRRYQNRFPNLNQQFAASMRT